KSGAPFISVLARMSIARMSHSAVIFFFNDPTTTETYTTTDTLSLHDALPISDQGRHRPLGRGHGAAGRRGAGAAHPQERSEEHTSELQSPVVISYAVFCL